MRGFQVGLAYSDYQHGVFEKYRNRFIFQGISMDPNEIIKVSYNWINQYTLIHTIGSKRRLDPFCAPSYSSMCVYLNTSGVIWNEMGKQILDYNHSLGKCSVFAVELWRILDGLLLLQKQGYDRVLIRSNNLEIIKTICDRNLIESDISLVKGI